MLGKFLVMYVVDVDEDVDGWGILRNVKECAEFHGVDRNGFVTKNEVGS